MSSPSSSSTDPGTPALRALTTPRAAAAAGLVFAVLYAVVIVLVRSAIPEGADRSVDWMASRHGAISTAGTLMPFAGISFLWFVAVVRDSVKRVEDKFFVTVLLGSGLLFLAMMFVSMAVAKGLVSAESAAANPVSADTRLFGEMMVLTTCKTYATRMAAVFMISLATIWWRTGLMPRWLAMLTYLTAVGGLAAGDLSIWVAMTFPAWVVVVSVLLLTRAGIFEHARRPAHG